MDQKAYLQSAYGALEAFPIKNATIEFISQSENICYYVRSVQGESFVLRLHRPSYHNLAELESEQLWTEALLDAGIDVPVALKTRDGQRYFRVKCPDGWRFAGMLEWVEGDVLANPATALRLQQAGESPFRLLGRLIAVLHKHAMGWEIPKGFRRQSLDVDGFVGESPFWGRFWESPELDRSCQANLLSMRNSIKDILVGYGNLSCAYSLIHGDLHTHNVIVHGSRLHIIDFDDSGFGWHAYDLAVALHNLRDSPQYNQFKSSLIDGYSEVRPISTQEVEMIELFLVVRSLASIGWVTARPDLIRDRAQICQELYDDATLRLKRVER